MCHFYDESPVVEFEQRARLRIPVTLQEAGIHHVVYGEDALGIVHFTVYQPAFSAFSSSSLQRTSLVLQILFAPNTLILLLSLGMLIVGATSHSLVWTGCMPSMVQTRSCSALSTSTTPVTITSRLISSSMPPLCTTSIFTTPPGRCFQVYPLSNCSRIL